MRALASHASHASQSAPTQPHESSPTRVRSLGWQRLVVDEMRHVGVELPYKWRGTPTFDKLAHVPDADPSTRPAGLPDRPPEAIDDEVCMAVDEEERGVRSGADGSVEKVDPMEEEAGEEEEEAGEEDEEDEEEGEEEGEEEEEMPRRQLL